MKVGGTPAHNCPEKGPSKNVAQVKNTGPSETLGGYLTCARFWH